MYHPCIQGLLPDDVTDPEAPFPFKLDPRLDAAQEMKRVSAQSPVRPPSFLLPACVSIDIVKQWTVYRRLCCVVCASMDVLFGSG